MEIVVYGDSFSNPDNCKARCSDMWYRHVAQENFDATVTNRARAGNNTQHMFLEATHDCVTNTTPLKMLIGLGPLARLPKYTDKWYDEELIRGTDITDYLGHMQSHRPTDADNFDIKDTRLMEMYHPTLLWANLYKNVISLDAMARKHGHDILIVHMHHTEYEHHRDHPLVRPLEEMATHCNYVEQLHSCNAVCRQAGILPWDKDQYGSDGHHSAEGQIHFGRHIRALLEERL